MIDMETELYWYWPREKFLNRKFVMQEMFEKYQEGEDFKLPNVSLYIWASTWELDRVKPRSSEQPLSYSSLGLYHTSLCVLMDHTESIHQEVPTWPLLNPLQDRDPFVEDPNVDMLVGTVKLWLQSLAYYIEMKEFLEITDFKGKNCWTRCRPSQLLSCPAS